MHIDVYAYVTAYMYVCMHTNERVCACMFMVTHTLDKAGGCCPNSPTHGIFFLNMYKYVIIYTYV